MDSTGKYTRVVMVLLGSLLVARCESTYSSHSSPPSPMYIMFLASDPAI
jgi:hypothetical protein